MGGCLISAARLKGETHNQCDDKIFFHRTNEITTSVLADGAGSKKMSSIGAKIATKTLSRAMPGLLTGMRFSNKSDLFQSAKELKENIVFYINDAIKSSQNFTGDISDYACTLLFATYVKNCNRWVIGHIGDGVICAMDCKDNIITISEPENGEFANETFFITDSEAISKLRIYIVKGIKGVVLASDGTAASIYSKNGIATGLLKFFKWQREYGEAKTSSILRKNIEQVFLKKTNDDCSILLHQLKNIEVVQSHLKVTKL